MVWKKNWFALGMAVLSLALVFAAFGDWTSGSCASQALVIGPAAGRTVQVYSTGSNNGRASYRPDGMVYELSVTADAIAVSSGMAYAADYCSKARARNACYWADGSERGPPKI